MFQNITLAAGWGGDYLGGRRGSGKASQDAFVIVQVNCHSSLGSRRVIAVG